MLSLIVAYRSFGRFRQASTRLDTPPLSFRHHPGSVIAPPLGADEGEVPVVATDVIPPSTAQGAAEFILQWAKQRRLFARTPMEDAADAVDFEPVAEPEAARMFSAPAVEGVLRRRAVNMILFNEPSKKVVVYTKSRVTAGDLKTIPVAVHDVAIEYAVGGSPAVKGSIPQARGDNPYFFHKDAYCCGSSIFSGNCMGAGTMGLLARGADGKLYGVTNNHVTGACNHAPPGMPILAPGPLDVMEDSIEPFCIGRHSRLVPINDGIPENMDISSNLDASSFEIALGAAVSSMQGNLCDTPSVVGEPVPGSIVEKVGRTTGHTQGRIVGQSISPLAVTYQVPEYGIRKSVFFKVVYIVEGLVGDFACRGDSGALVMSVTPSGERKAVGLVFAGDEQRRLSYVLPISEVLDRLDLTICSGLNV